MEIMPQRIIIGWVYGSSVQEMLDMAYVVKMDPDQRLAYEPCLIIGRPVGSEGKLRPLWKIKQERFVFPCEYAAKVTYTLRREFNIHTPAAGDQLSMFE